MRGSSGGSAETEPCAESGFVGKDKDGAVRSVEAREEEMISIAAASGSFPFPCPISVPVPEEAGAAAAAAAASRSLCNCFFVFPCVVFFLGLGGEGS